MSAATTFFNFINIKAYKFVDGGLGANNLVDEVEGEVLDIWCFIMEDLKPFIKCFVSIKTRNLRKKVIEDNMLKFFSRMFVDFAT